MTEMTEEATKGLIFAVAFWTSLRVSLMFVHHLTRWDAGKAFIVDAFDLMLLMLQRMPFGGWSRHRMIRDGLSST